MEACHDRFPALDISRFSELIALYFFRRKHYYAGTNLENLSDKGLEDIGLEPSRRDFDAVKPFCMP